VCLGAIDVPEIADYRFEPVIFMPTDILRRRLGLIPVGAAALGVWLVDRLGWPTLPGGLPHGALEYYLLGGVVIAAIWAWRAGVRPRYFRLAPGVVQAIRFGLIGQRPAIQSYPMVGGTVVGVPKMGFEAKAPMVATMYHRGAVDVLRF
jgi:hypothetical protein